MNASLSGAHQLLHIETSQVDIHVGSTHLPSAVQMWAQGVGLVAGAPPRSLDPWEQISC